MLDTSAKVITRRMLRCLSRIFRRKLPAALIGLLALSLLGVAAPVSAAPNNDVAALLAEGAICSAAADLSDRGAPKPHAHRHAQCVLCQLGGTPFVAPDRMALPPPGRLVRIVALSLKLAAAPQPAPLAYASRAPPNG